MLVSFLTVGLFSFHPFIHFPEFTCECLSHFCHSHSWIHLNCAMIHKIHKIEFGKSRVTVCGKGSKMWFYDVLREITQWRLHRLAQNTPTPTWPSPQHWKGISKGENLYRSGLIDCYRIGLTRCDITCPTAGWMVSLIMCFDSLICPFRQNQQIIYLLPMSTIHIFSEIRSLCGPPKEAGLGLSMNINVWGQHKLWEFPGRNNKTAGCWKMFENLDRYVSPFSLLPSIYILPG